MRGLATFILPFGAALVAAQTSVNPNAFSIPEGQSSYEVTAGQTVNLAWTNQSGDTVTIKMQQSGQITPDSGVTLAERIPNTGSYTVTVPSSEDVPNSGAYTFEIIDDSGAAQPNFSPNFSVSSASGTAGFGSATASASTTGSTASASASATTTNSSSASSTSSSSSASRTSASSTTSRASSTSSAATSSGTAASTSAPNSNAGTTVKAPLAAAIILGVAAFFF